MYHRPNLDLGTALVVFCILFALGIAGVLGGCTTAKPAAGAAPVGVHEYRHDHRTRHAEPYTTSTTRH